MLKKTTAFPGRCHICGIPSQYSFYGVVSCRPCKMFFRRHADNGQGILRCDFDGHCEININNRHICPACRLDKCFSCGMNVDKFRSWRLTSSQSKPTSKQQLAKFPTINLLEADDSLLSTHEWTLLSNLSHCYDESQILRFTERLITDNDASESVYLIYKTLVDQFLVTVYDTAGDYLRLNDDFRHLSKDDRSIMMRSAADNVCCIGGAYIMQHCHLYVVDAFLQAMNEKYGKSTMDIHLWARKFIDPDLILVKLAISLFAFSENTCCYDRNRSNDLTNPIAILAVQNKYVEMTWKYLLYKYGYADAVKRFLNISLWLSSMNTLAVHAQTLAVHVKDINSIIEQTELKLVLDDIEENIDT